jgi:membrane-bound lytic murein transglycosylase F
MLTPAIKAKTILIIASVLFIGLIFKARFCATGRENTIYPFSALDSLQHPVYIDLDAIRKRGKLVALTDYSSTSYFIYKGEPMGFEFEMLSAFAHSIGVPLQVKVASDMDRIFFQLNNGEADIIAANLTVTQDRSRIVAFTEPLMDTRQVLVQRRPENWKRMTSEQIDKVMVRNPADLAGKVVHVRKWSSFYERLKNLSDEIGSEIYIIQAGGDKETEQLISMVANGEIDYTVADENVAMINQTYYPNIDIRTPISFKQHIAWAVRRNSPELLDALDQWLKEEQNTGAQRYIFAKYFRNNKAAEERIESDYFSLNGGKISIYDDLIKTYSKKIDFDWRLVASLIYEESHFDATAQSWAGAYGLMQLIPSASVQFGIDSIGATPLESIRAGTQLLARIDNYWKDIIPDKTERMKFDLASYNVGTGHVIDARNLAIKYGKDPGCWDENVAWALAMKSNSKYFNDPVVKFGYCRGNIPCIYVKEIMARYEHYCNFIKEEGADNNNSIVKE